MIHCSATRSKNRFLPQLSCTEKEGHWEHPKEKKHATNYTGFTNYGGKCMGGPPAAHMFIRAIREIRGCFFHNIQRSVGRMTLDAILFAE